MGGFPVVKREEDDLALPMTLEFWAANAHKSGEQIAREQETDGGNVRAQIIEAKEIWPNLDWRIDPRHGVKQSVPLYRPRALKLRPGHKVAIKTEVIVSDLHVPYHDPIAVGCVLGFCKDTKPDGFTIDGDFIDAYSVSSFSKDPQRELCFQQELDEANAILDLFDSVLPKDCIKRFVVGNHEARIERYKRDYARAFHGLRVLKLDELLRLSERGYELVPMVGRDASVHIGKVEVGHFNVARKDSGASARTLLLDRGCNVLQAHTHKLAAIHKRNRGTGEQLGAWEIGCLCDLNPEYITSPSWQQGFATITRSEGSNRFHVALHEIIGGELFAGGRRY